MNGNLGGTRTPSRGDVLALPGCTVVRRDSLPANYGLLAQVSAPDSVTIAS